MSLWDVKKQSAIQRDLAAQRLDCFISVVYLFPNCLDPRDMDLLAKREDELSKIYKYTGRTFFATYVLGVAGYYFTRGRTPYFKDVAKHSVLSIGGMFGSALLAEKMASEVYYNKLLI